MTASRYDRPHGPARRSARVLPSHFALTDPARFPDTMAFARHIPPGWGVIYRHFGATDRAQVAEQMAALAKMRGWLFLIANDPELAAECSADGVHWPEVRLAEAVRWRRSHRNRVMTLSAHSRSAVRKAALAGADAAMLSPVCATDSKGSGLALGWQRAASIAQCARLPVYGLGGLTRHDSQHAQDLGFTGIAMVSGVVA